MAQALRDTLKSRAVEITHSESLELIAKAFGYDNWNILAAKIEAPERRGGAAPPLSLASAPDSVSHEMLPTVALPPDITIDIQPALRARCHFNTLFSLGNGVDIGVAS